MVELETYIRKWIIPDMNKRRGRTDDLNSGEVLAKIYSPDPGKPGEGYELFVEMQKLRGELTPAAALEIADGVYYRLQPNAGQNIGIGDFLRFLEVNLGVDAPKAYGFCIVKYLTRLNYGDSPDYEEIEKKVMARHLRSLPKIAAFAPDTTAIRGLLRMFDECDWLWG